MTIDLQDNALSFNVGAKRQKVVPTVSAGRFLSTLSTNKDRFRLRRYSHVYVICIV
jgi:outer membrane protein TolC